MAYQKPAAGYSKPAAARPAAPKAVEVKKKGNRPDFRIILTEMVGEKEVTVKGEDGKSVVIGAAWKSPFDFYNVKFEDGTRGRLYPTDDKPAE